MVCDNCEQQAHFYIKVLKPDTAKTIGSSGIRYWCPSCVDGVPSGVKAPFVNDGIATLQQKINRLEEDNRMAHGQNKKLGSRLAMARADNERLLHRIRKLQDSAYWGPPYHSIFAAQQQQYNEMMQAQLRQMQSSVRPSVVMPGSGLGCYPPGTELISKKMHDDLVNSLNEQLKSQQENFEKQQEKLDLLREKIGLWRKCDIKDRCPACEHEMENVLKETK